MAKQFHLADLFETVAATVPDRIAIRAASATLTYAELNDRADRLAAGLAAQGVKRGDTVGLYLMNGPAFLEGFIAATKLGAVPYNVNYRYRADELRYLFANAESAAILHGAEFSDVVREVRGDVPTLKVSVAVDDGSGADISGSLAYDDLLKTEPAGPYDRHEEDILLTYTGGTTLNTGTLVIGNAAAAGTGMITQSSGSSLLKFDTSGTISNNMSIYNVASNQTMTLSGSITAQNTTYDVASGTTLSINGTISGSGGVTKNGTGTLTLNGNNTFTGNTTINSGTLRAGAANALGDSLEVMVNSGGSLLIAASEAIDNAAAVKLNGGTMKFDGNVTETLGAFTLLANSTIDMADGHIWLQFSGLSAEMTHELKIYNYTINSDHLYFDSNTYLENSLDNIKFYSDSGSNLIGDSFIRNSFEVYPAQPNIVPEPETYATAALLLLGLGIYAYRRRQVRTPA